MKIIVILLIALILNWQDVLANSQTCAKPARTFHVFHVNGIHTTFQNAFDSKEGLSNALGNTFTDSKGNDHRIVYDLLYNPTFLCIWGHLRSLDVCWEPSHPILSTLD
jgi:hypothetical protein